MFKKKFSTKFFATSGLRSYSHFMKEHWDVLQDEATKAESVSGLPMFGDAFPKRQPSNALVPKAFDTLFYKSKEEITMKSSAVANEMYVILGATGNTGSIIANSLLAAGKKVRVVGRDVGRLQRFVDKGAEAFMATMSDAAALSKAFSSARAAYLLLPPAKSREDQERDSDAIAKAVKESGLGYAIHLSSCGAQVPEGTGPVAGLHSSEQKLNAISGLNVLHLRAAYFMENNLAAIGMIHQMGLFGNALLPDLKIPMAATRDVGDYAAQRLLHLDFSGKQTRELLGERDLSMTEATAV